MQLRVLPFLNIWRARRPLLAGCTAIALLGCDAARQTTVLDVDHDVSLAFAAQVIAAPGAEIEAIVRYTPSGGSTVILGRGTASVNTGGAGTLLTVTANVGACVRSANATNGGAPCVVTLAVTLTRDGALLDEATQQLQIPPTADQVNAAPVQLNEVETVTISGATAALANFEPGDGVSLTATARDRNGLIVVGRSTAWSVVSGGISVSQSGQLTAVSSGAAVVRTSIAGRTKDLAVTVRQASVDTLTLTPLDTTIVAGATATYRVTAKSPYGVVLTNRPIAVTSSNTSVATVTPLVAGQTYTAQGLQAGTVTITATSLEGRGGTTVTRATTLQVLAAQGRLGGLLVNNSDSIPIAGASVQIRRASDNVLVQTVTTAANGSWTSIPLNAATYNLQFSATSFTSVTVTGVVLSVGPSVPTTTVATVRMVPTNSSSGSGGIAGAVRDATNNAAIAAATVELRPGVDNVTGTAIATTTTTANGTYSFSPQQYGTYTIRASRSGFVDGSDVVTVTSTQAIAPTVFLSPVGSGVAWRFVLQWGASPSDLDAHLTGPIVNSQSRFHVWWDDEGSLGASPFAALDIDQTTGFGPETITMAQEFAGTYRFYVHNFSQETSLRSSSARVTVYRGNVQVASYSPPQTDGEFWTVFEITNGTLVPINVINNIMPSVRAGETVNHEPQFGPFKSPSPAAAAAAEWGSLMPWHWVKRDKR